MTNNIYDYILTDINEDPSDFANINIPIEAYEEEINAEIITTPVYTKKYEKKDDFKFRKKNGCSVLYNNDKYFKISIKGRDGKTYSKFIVEKEYEDDLIRFFNKEYLQIKIADKLYANEQDGSISRDGKMWINRHEKVDCIGLFY